MTLTARLAESAPTDHLSTDYLSIPPPCGDPLPLDGTRVLPEYFARTVEMFGDRVALRTVGSDVEYTWHQYAELVRRLAARAPDGFSPSRARRAVSAS